jgi:S1-C subfamily serine protease
VVDPLPKQSARQEVIDGIVGSSVKVLVERNGRPLTFASGIVIASRPSGQDGEAVSYVLTVAHALTGGADTSVFVGFCGSDARRGKLAATVIGRGKPETEDLALLRVPGLAVPAVVFPEGEQVRLGRQILVVGFPEGQRLGISGGIVSQLPLSENENGIPAERAEQRIVIDAAAPRGVSGGGVFEAETGRFLGIVQGHQTVSFAVKDQAQSYTLKLPVPGATFVVPAAQIRSFLAGPTLAQEMSGASPATARVLPTPSR